MPTINVEKKPTKVTNTSGTYHEYLKEFTLEHKALVNGEEISITTLLWLSDNGDNRSVELGHQHGPLETFIRAVVSQWLLEEGLLDPYYAVLLKQTGRAYVYTKEAFAKIIRFLNTMSEQNKENNRHDHQH